MGQIGVARKVDPEEAIDTTARRDRIEKLDYFKDGSKDRTERKIDQSATDNMRNNRLKDISEEIRRQPRDRGINMRY